MKPSNEAMLKPCPGCGDEPNRLLVGPVNINGPKYLLRCYKCNWQTWGNMPHEAITAWNTRAVIDRALSPVVDADAIGQAAIDDMMIAFAAAKTTADAATVEQCAIAARDALLGYEWPPQDGDEQIDAVLAAIRQLGPVERVDDVAGWQPIETAPRDEFILLCEDGMMRCGMWEGGKWVPAEIPVLVDEVGNRIVSRELAMIRPGQCLELSGFLYDPTHWMPRPAPPAIKRGDFRQSGEG